MILQLTTISRLTITTMMIKPVLTHTVVSITTSLVVSVITGSLILLHFFPVVLSVVPRGSQEAEGRAREAVKEAVRIFSEDQEVISGLKAMKVEGFPERD